jgi:hypothetical protein
VRARSSLLPLLQTEDSRVHKTASEMQLREQEEMDHLLNSTDHLKQYATRGLQLQQNNASQINSGNV